MTPNWRKGIPAIADSHPPFGADAMNEYKTIPRTRWLAATFELKVVHEPHILVVTFIANMARGLEYSSIGRKYLNPRHISNKSTPNPAILRERTLVYSFSPQRNLVSWSREICVGDCCYVSSVVDEGLRLSHYGNLGLSPC